MTRKLTTMFALTIMLLSCSTDKNRNMTMGQDKFTWNVQLAGYDFSKADQKGETSFEAFIEEFENFPWMEQLDSFQRILSGCSPTMTVNDLKTGKDFWVSMGGDRNEHVYLIGYIYPKEKKGLFGFGKPKTIRWLEIYLTEDKNLVKKCFNLFFHRKYDQLEDKIGKLEKYDELEAKDLAE